MKRIAARFLLVLCAAASLHAAAPTSDEIRKIIAERVDAGQGVGIVVGVIDPSGRRIVSYGARDLTGKEPVGGDTVFEIGSVTKVFTSLLLADAVARGEVALSDPVAKYLPAEVKVPERGGRKITLQDLATHTSALPRMPSNFAPKNPANPYADYTTEQMYAFLSSYELTRDIGAQYEYSNLGAGLLGHILARRADMDYETLVRKRILEPLGMKSTSIALSGLLKARLAVGHNELREATANWDLPTFAGAGALRSTVNDMLLFLGAMMGFRRTTLSPAMTAMLKDRKPAGADMQVALGWHFFTTPDRPEIVWHNGGTGGYRSFVGFDPKTRVGVVVLSNMTMPGGVDDIGRHLLDPAAPLRKMRKAVKVDPKIYDAYVGNYELRPGFILSVTREGDRLFTQATGQAKFEAFPESQRDFFLKVVDAQLTFQPDAGGRAASVVLHQGGRDITAKRFEGQLSVPKERKEIAVDPAILDRYVGRYQLAPGFILTFTREGNTLFTQATGQPKFPLFAETERDFFLKVVDAQVTFVVDESGKATKVILHQNGDHEAKRIE